MSARGKFLSRSIILGLTAALVFGASLFAASGRAIAYCGYYVYYIGPDPYVGYGTDTCPTPVGASDCGGDGRVNTNCSAPEILYCNNGMMEFYAFDDKQGLLDFVVDPDSLPDSVDDTTLVAQDGQVKLYLNPDGTLTLTAPQPDGKTYFMIFENCVSLAEGAEY